MSLVLWFTGRSGAGKTTLSTALEKALLARGQKSIRIDGDDIRQGLCQDLGFSLEDRRENIRRAAQTAALIAKNDIPCLCAFITPLEEYRELAKQIIGPAFHEIYVHAPLETCASRDVKGLYKKVEKGEISNFTGVSSPFEEPKSPALMLDTCRFSVTECVDIMLNFIDKK